jgi:aspartyl-tRNA(Asn)/glutamyl-tRNA(Gln) amidotransferase subunit B
MPELPVQLAARFEGEYGLSAYDASTLTASRDTARLLLRRGREGRRRRPTPRPAANWVMGDLAARLNKDELDVTRLAGLSAVQLAGLVARIADNTISNNIAKKGLRGTVER